MRESNLANVNKVLTLHFRPISCTNPLKTGVGIWQESKAFPSLILVGFIQLF